MATHASIPAWEISWKFLMAGMPEDPGSLQSTESQKSLTQLSDQQQQSKLII